MKKRLKIFIYRTKPSHKAIWANWLFKCEPLELEYLYTVLKNYADINLIDGQVEKFNLAREVARHRPDILLLTALITDVNKILNLSSEVKKRVCATKIFVGGPHAEVMPQHFYSPHIDGVFFNNQLVAIERVVKAILEGQAYNHIAGAAFPVNGEFRENIAVKVDYKNFPIPERPLLKKYKGKYNLFYFDDCASVKTAFGCPGKCTYCFCRKMNQNRFNYRPLVDVIREIESIQNENIYILDDNFLLSPKRLRSFCEEIKKRSIHKKFIVYGTSRSIARQPGLMKDLKDAGLSAVLVGMEFIRDDALAAVNKSSDQADNEACIKVCRELDIELICLFMIDPDWPAIEYKKLADFVNKRKIYFAVFASFTTCPGTDLWEQKGEEPVNLEKLWRYDFLRLHHPPKHNSQLRYYSWLMYLYLRLIFRTGGFYYLKRRAGLKKTIRMFSNGIASFTGFYFKVIIWP